MISNNALNNKNKKTQYSRGLALRTQCSHFQCLEMRDFNY